MKSILIASILVLVLGTSCTSVQTRVSGTLLVDRSQDEAPVQFSYEAVESHSTIGLAVACLLTGIYYGGACWAYLALPFDDHEILALEHAREDAMQLGRCAALTSLRVDGAGYSAQSRKVRVVSPSGVELNELEIRRLCERPARRRPPAPPDEDHADPPQTLPDT
jgi:hypothetical protein